MTDKWVDPGINANHPEVAGDAAEEKRVYYRTNRVEEMDDMDEPTSVMCAHCGEIVEIPPELQGGPQVAPYYCDACDVSA